MQAMRTSENTTARQKDSKKKSKATKTKAAVSDVVTLIAPANEDIDWTRNEKSRDSDAATSQSK